MSDDVWLDGVPAVEAVFDSGSREVFELLVDETRFDGPTARLERMAASAGASVIRLSGAEVAARAGLGSAPSVAARVGPRRFASLEALLDHPGAPAILMLDGVEDPHNFGQAVRSAYACGLTGLVVRPRNWFSAAATVARASAGASERMPTAVADSPEAAADFFRSHGLALACADEERAAPPDQADLTGPLFLVVGGERRGISRTLLAGADLRLGIPYGRPFSQSLGAAAATAILAYEIMRQRAGGSPA